jgi:hypothetical protein
VESAVFADDWRHPEAYEALDDLPPAALAWEFLRRNPDYRADYNQFIEETAAGAEAEAEAPRFGRWGLTFRG